MADFPQAGYFSDAERSNAEQKTALEAFLGATRQLPGAGGALSTLVIASGVITPTVGAHIIDTQGNAVSDDLTTIAATNLPDAALLFLRSAAPNRVVVVKHAAGGAGQIALADSADLALTDPTMGLLLRRAGALWEEVLRGFGNQTFARRVREGLAYLPVGRGADVPAALTLNVGLDGDYFHVTSGGSGITALRAMPAGQVVRLVFDAAPTIVHSSALILAGAVNYIPLVGDTMTFLSESPGVWREQGRSGLQSETQEYATVGSFTWTKPQGVSRILLSGSAPGGGGGPGSGGAPAGGGGGGAGEQLWRAVVDVTGDLTIVIGAGGASGADGGGTTISGPGISISLAGGLHGINGGSGSQGGNGGGYGRGTGGTARSAGNPGVAEGVVFQGGAGGGGGDLAGAPPYGAPGGPGGILPGGPGTTVAYGGGGGGSSVFGIGGGGGVVGGTGGAGTRGSGGGGGGSGYTSGGKGGDGVVRVEVVR